MIRLAQQARDLRRKDFTGSVNFFLGTFEVALLDVNNSHEETTFVDFVTFEIFGVLLEVFPLG